ncbi:MAG: DNA primase [Proteobacteria bacterium]|nr:DNA primase [Pseudomonadota bacterium]
MLPFIPNDKIEEIRERCSIVSIVSGYVSLKKAGSNYLGLCPFHNEKTPSFTVNEDKGIFHCFGCGTGGNVYSFLTRIEGKSFPEVVRDLAEKEGVELPSPDKSVDREEEEEKDRQRSGLISVHRKAADLYHNLLMRSPEGQVARDYLKGRGITGDLAREWKLGYGGKGWSSLFDRLEGDEEVAAAENGGLIIKGKKGTYYDRFRERLIFPISDLRGNVVAFGGRILSGDGPKYMNSPESPVYTKGKLLYGLERSREAVRTSGEAIVVEGYMDLLAMYGAGVKNVVAPLGTALVLSQARQIKRFCDSAIVLFDSDSAGIKAAVRGIDVLVEAGVAPKVLTLPEGEDPDSFIRGRGAEALSEKLGEALPGIDFLLDIKLAEVPSSSPHDRAKVIREIKPYIAKITDSIEKALTVKRVAERMSVDEQLISDAVLVSSGKRLPRKEERLAEPLQKKKKGYAAEEMIVSLMLHEVEVLERALGSDIVQKLKDEHLRKIAALMDAFFRDGRDVTPAALMDAAEGEGLEAKISRLGVLESFSEDVSPLKIFEECEAAVKEQYLIEKEQLISESLKVAQEKNDKAMVESLLREKHEVLMTRKKGFLQKGEVDV